MGKPLESPPNMDDEQKEPLDHWGIRLREIRNSRGISLEDVAAELHLKLSLLKNIEDEDLDSLPSAPFVKGYLRNYARMLEIDSEPVIEAYNQVCGEDAPGLALVNQIKETNSGDKAPRYATWAVVTVMIISFMIWWWSEILSPAVNSKAQLPDASNVAEAPSQSQPTVVDEVEVVQDYVAELPASDSTEIDSVPVEDVSPETELDAPVLEEPVDLATIELQFEADSWVEITDARDKKLFLNIGKAGQGSTVEGVAPFKVLLGNSPGVVMQYKGEPFDHSIYEKKGIASFTLGEE